MKWRKEGRDGYALAGEVIASGRKNRPDVDSDSPLGSASEG